jgi:U5 snRNP spliceosome subunit
MKRLSLRATAALVLLASLLPLQQGCSQKSAEKYGSKKEDWAKSTPPPQYRGPGQPGGPPAGPLQPPPGPPPGVTTGQ